MQPQAGTIKVFEEDPCIDWSVDDSLCTAFKTQNLKCVNVPEAELVTLSENKKR